MRCDKCGNVEWSLLGAPKLHDCPVCSTPLKPERRRPGRFANRLQQVERRDVHQPRS